MERKNKKIVAGMMAGFCVLSTQTLVQYGLLVGNGGIATKNSSSLQAFGTSNKNALEDQHQEELDASRDENEEIVEVEKKLDDLKIKDDDDAVGILDDNNVYDHCQYRLSDINKTAALVKCINTRVHKIIIPKYVKGKDGTKYRVTAIYGGAFVWCLQLTKIFISQFVESVGDIFTYYSEIARSVETIDVDPDNQFYKSIDGDLYDKKGTTLDLRAPAKERNKEWPPFGMPYIAPKAHSAFVVMKELEPIKLPEPLTLPRSIAVPEKLHIELPEPSLGISADLLF